MSETKESLRVRLADNEQAVEDALKGYCAEADEDLQVLFDAEEYSLLGGGKRIRPFLVNEICRALGGDTQVSMPFACALEMIHTYSLIHDDLPCMDDDDLRRGKPTNHKVFGYATALLAGDALLTKAFAVAASNSRATDTMRAEAVRLIAEAAGECGMIGGQIMDLAGETEDLSFDQLCRLHGMKTGALIECAATLGVLSAGYAPNSKEADAAIRYARKVGLAFQVVDDLLDVKGNEALLGKPVGTDASHNKTTFLSFFTPEEAEAYALKLTEEAIGALDGWTDKEILCTLAEYLATRNY